jgi:hypothetical protein
MVPFPVKWDDIAVSGLVQLAATVGAALVIAVPVGAQMLAAVGTLKLICLSYKAYAGNEDPRNEHGLAAEEGPGQAHHDAQSQQAPGQFVRKFELHTLRLPYTK